MNVAQRKDQGCHTLSPNEISKEARRRLEQIKLDDIDTIYSFRIQKPERLWCWRLENLMVVLWWDPTHQVYPIDITDNSNRAGSRGSRGRRR